VGVDEVRVPVTVGRDRLDHVLADGRVDDQVAAEGVRDGVDGDVVIRNRRFLIGCTRAKLS
jgi:hypothetical protein